MNDADFGFIAALLKERSGYVIGPDKLYLLETRLSSIMREHGHRDLAALVAAIRMSRPEPLIVAVVEAMTTNETSFFRDHGPFTTFRNSVLPALLEQRAAQRHLRIWSAACSTGQEPYSLAMILREHQAALQGWRVDIVATDICRRVLARAEEGAYSTFEIQRGMPIQLLMKYFEQTADGWRVRQELRRMIDFRPCNLLADITALGTFDLVFCRNVLIYFDQPTKRDVLASIAKRMAPDGYLMLGGAESAFGITDAFGDIPGMRGVYRRANAKTNLFQTAFNKLTNPASPPNAGAHNLGVSNHVI
jgi:chemotaxis protein methyltransferase CheR